jgi:hypothetical protein
LKKLLFKKQNYVYFFKELNRFSDNAFVGRGEVLNVFNGPAQFELGVIPSSKNSSLS